MTDYAAIAGEVRREAPEAPGSIVEHDIRRGAIEFCRESRIWRERLSVDLKQGEQVARLRVTGGVVDQVYGGVVKFATGRIGRLTKATNTTKGYNHNAFPFAFSERPGGIIEFLPEPNEQGTTAEFDVVVIPSRSSTSVPDWIGEKWWDAFVFGGIWYLLSQPNQPWSNMERAAYFRQLFYQHAADAKKQALSFGRVQQSFPLRKWR